MGLVQEISVIWLNPPPSPNRFVAKSLLVHRTSTSFSHCVGSERADTWICLRHLADPSSFEEATHPGPTPVYTDRVPKMYW